MEENNIDEMSRKFLQLEERVKENRKKIAECDDVISNLKKEEVKITNI